MRIVFTVLYFEERFDQFVSAPVHRGSISSVREQ
jgi:hypothetical protein